ncbi:MAG: fibronectin type III domain-containing protein [Candidatus Sulfotelmatobacter sp.]
MKSFPRKLLLGLGLPLMLGACATMGPPKPPSLELPQPPSDLRAARKGARVTLTWTIPAMTTDRQTVRSLGPTRICRGLQPVLTECGTPAGVVPAPQQVATKAAAGKKRAANYADMLAPDLQQSNPASFVTYAAEVLNQDGHSAGLSNQVQVPAVAALPPLSNFAGEVTAQGVRLSWALPPAPEKAPNVRALFRIYRRQEGAAENKIADLDLEHCPGMTAPPPKPTPAPDTPQAAEQAEEPCPVSYLDQTFDWEKTYFYRGTAVLVIAQTGKPAFEVEGDDTLEVRVFADDVFPPAVPSGLQTVFSGPGQQPFIDLIWAPVTDVDLDGYNVYRHEEGGAPVKVNPELTKTPAYRDANVISGKTYFYAVSAVDVRGNESARSEEASERVP